MTQEIPAKARGIDEVLQQSPATAAREKLSARFHHALGNTFDPERPILLVGHFDADGLAAIAILARALPLAGYRVAMRIAGKGENPWTEPLRAELQQDRNGGLIIADLGVRDGEPVPGTPTILIDHHVPVGVPGSACVISGNGLDPEPPTALIAFWCAKTLGNADALLWLAAIGVTGDMAGEAGFPEMSEAWKRYGKTSIRNAVSLLNAGRRAAAADARPALDLLLRCNHPREVTSGEHPETQYLLAAKEELNEALRSARRVAPVVRGKIALICFSSPCQVHPLVAQQWRGRFKGKIVIAANTGYRDGWVHFAARTHSQEDLLRFLAEHRPAGADGNYGSGHMQATGGALRYEAWNEFVANLGFLDQRMSVEAAR